MNNKPKFGIIYKATNVVNNKSYIGQTIDILEKRIHSHKKSSFRKNHSQYNYLFHRAIRKYGIESFLWEIIEVCNTPELNDKEIFYIKQFKTYAPDGENGYNLTRGGDNNFGSSGKYHYLNRMSKRKKELWLKKNRIGCRNPNFNNPNLKGENHFTNKMSDDDYEKWVSNFKGDNNYQKKLSKRERKERCWINKLSKEEKENWKINNIVGENNPFFKAVKNNPEKYRGKNNPLFGVSNIKAQKEYIVTFPDGHEEKIKGLREFCRQYGLNNGNMVCCANGRYKQYKGFRCKHV